MKVPAALVRFTLLTIALGGCGSSDIRSDGGGLAADGGFSTGVSGSKVLGQLASMDQSQLCMNVVTFTARSLLPDACRLQSDFIVYGMAAQNTSASDVDLQSSCSSAYEKCLNPATDVTPPTTDGGSDASDTSGTAVTMCEASLQGCSATVSELSSCLSDLSHAYDILPMCGMVTRTGLQLLALDGGPVATELIVLPDSCVVLADKCPKVLSTGSVDAGA